MENIVAIICLAWAAYCIFMLFGLTAGVISIEQPYAILAKKNGVIVAIDLDATQENLRRFISLGYAIEILPKKLAIEQFQQQEKKQNETSSAVDK